MAALTVMDHRVSGDQTLQCKLFLSLTTLSFVVARTKHEDVADGRSPTCAGVRGVLPGQPVHT